ncbi:hypothetical protein HSB1_11220 [Halogranum salarium B-1]|uniref:Uncharacterized protein n=1 Tax=Halogranum salarium B-1 TaxID=1210908 RepID=J3JGY0_9EURY|nr:hypothetical protein HSB1_11220 [Halogranum salarium B-1]
MAIALRKREVSETIRRPASVSLVEQCVKKAERSSFFGREFRIDGYADSTASTSSS